MKKNFLFIALSIFLCGSVALASSVVTRKPFPYEQGIALTKNVLYMNARELAAGAGLGTLWSDTFKDNSQINAGASSNYTYRGAVNYDVILNSSPIISTPVMTSNNTPSGVASAQVDAANAYKMFDQNAATYLSDQAHSGMNKYLRYDFGAGNEKTIIRYTIQAANVGVPERTPRNFLFQGSNNGTDWTTIDTQSAQVFAGAETKTYACAGNVTAYRYYQLYVTAVSGGDEIIVAEFGLYIAGATQAVVRSNAITLSESVSEVMPFVDMTLGTGSLDLVRVSANGGTNWKDVTGSLDQVVALGHSGSSLIMEVTFSGDSELEFWGVSA